jgi:tRNA1Val (adenine37-N6)-methyltransferase
MPSPVLLSERAGRLGTLMSRELNGTGLQRPDETLDELRPMGLRLLQKKDGYRFSLDPILLCAFATRLPQGEIADLGTGCGIIPLLLAPRATGRLLGIEIQPELADRARRNVLLNGLDERVEILCGDLRQLTERLDSGGFSAVFANPPYRTPGTGRQAPGAERAAARHELAGGLPAFVAAAARLLGHGGCFYIIHLAERLTEVLTEMRASGLEPKRLRCIHSRLGDPARLVLVEGRKRGRAGLVVESPLMVYADSGYSAEVLAMYEPSAGSGGEEIGA